MFLKKWCFDSFAISTRKRLCQSLLTYWKETPHSCFPVYCVKCFKNAYFEEPLQVVANNHSK